MVEFATLIGAPYSAVNKWAKFDYIPVHRISARKMCVRYEEAIKAEVVVSYLARRGKKLPPPNLEETAIIPRVPERPQPIEPLYAEAPEPKRETFTVIVSPPIAEAKPEPRVEKEESLHLAARQLAKPYIDQARECAKRGEKQAERVLLWLALESLGFGPRPN